MHSFLVNSCWCLRIAPSFGTAFSCLDLVRASGSSAGHGFYVFPWFYLRNYHIKAWIKCNLTNPKMFAKKPIDWELIVSSSVVINACATGMYLDRPRLSIARQRDRLPWTPPPYGWVKVNTDAAQGEGVGLMTAGGLIRDSNGQWCGGFSKFLRVCSIIDAELWGLILD
ncbi:hypothetical protein V6N11_049575 [Hibiscus sabdariffa]|uniref:RNase H type-1 domain-containing protein n=1 Tax=Hibiscus sabdariffa TaxID=183260 RepID=A0ABR2NMZ9_9ROSI